MTETEPAVAVMTPDIRPGLRAGTLPLDRLRWPLGRPARLSHPGAALADLSSADHLIGFVQNLGLWRPGRGTRARVSIVMAEPAAIHGHHHRRLARVAHRFHRILGYDEALLDAVPNGIFFPYGSTWIPDWREREVHKTAMCSLIASEKRSQPGHRLRHALTDRIRRAGLDVEIMGRGYRPFADKADGLAPFRYSLVIENVREKNYFTEKLIDAILCRTVPIYWGCPNIGDFLDVSGMIPCEGEDEMIAALQGMCEEDYAARLPSLEAAIPTAAAYADLFQRAALAVLADAPVPQGIRG